ncbi:MAG: hypothetical protein IT443_08460 [Phycisphaeraceae bacterium]|nr:hypothetical protein [Phycisphaeraceae bacterium]
MSRISGLPDMDAKESGESQDLEPGIAGRPEDMPEAEEFSSGRGGLPSINQGTLLIVLIAAVGAGSLYAMRLSRTDFGAGAGSKVEARIEQALAKLTRPEVLDPNDPLLKKNLNTLFQDTDAIVEMFSTNPADHQVPINMVKKNPFRPQSAKVATTGNDDSALAERELEKRKAALVGEARKLKLNSIVGGRVPMALINSDLCREGSTVGIFKVRKIRTDELAVELESAGMLFVLRMESNSGNSTGVKRGIFGAAE